MWHLRLLAKQMKALHAAKVSGGSSMPSPEMWALKRSTGRLRAGAGVLNSRGMMSNPSILQWLLHDLSGCVSRAVGCVVGTLGPLIRSQRNVPDHGMNLDKTW